jgi:hypothetical protein
MNEAVSIRSNNPTLGVYAAVGLVLAALTTVIVWVTGRPAEPVPEPRALLGPVFALVALTGLITLLMIFARNIAVMVGRASAAYYADYKPEAAPAEWIERPARTFNNLMQVPVLFYLACVLMLVTGTLDRAQLALAWMFVAVRGVHALIYIGWNYVPARFAAWVSGCIVLGVLWARFALQSGAF